MYGKTIVNIVFKNYGPITQPAKTCMKLSVDALLSSKFLMDFFLPRIYNLFVDKATKIKMYFITENNKIAKINISL